MLDYDWNWGLKRVSPYFIKNCVMHIPPEIEQVRISNFLYAQCAELDNVLEKTRASIEEYKKLKQAVITQAVTKGIRDDREMKDSGIAWIGEIPIEWENSQVKYSLKWKSEKGQPQEEQQKIVNYLDKKCSAIDELIARKEQYLSEIEDYKKSLIYEYVTGKKEVPQK